MSRERDDEGKYTEMATIDAVLDVLASTDDPVLTSSEVAEAIGVSSETARRKLTELHDQGLVKRKEVGARAVVWWTVEEA
ncbi:MULTISPECIES: MarR family transcriptional regulator [Salinibaculum]|uniref:MarR family transcriptional regulator n=1 Tax=Salinibaculum TaxID=2732368 RepID=UPI0030D12A0D